MDLLDSAFALVPSEIMNDAFLYMQLKPVLGRNLEAASEVCLCSTFMPGSNPLLLNVGRAVDSF